MPALVAAISPAVNAVLDKPGDTLDNAIRENVLITMERLKTATPIISQLVEQMKLRVVGGVYRLATGCVELVS